MGGVHYAHTKRVFSYQEPIQTQQFPDKSPSSNIMSYIYISLVTVVLDSRWNKKKKKKKKREVYVYIFLQTRRSDHATPLSKPRRDVAPSCFPLNPPVVQKGVS